MAREQTEVEYRDYYLSLREKDFFLEIEERDSRIRALEAELRETQLSPHKAQLAGQHERIGRFREEPMRTPWLCCRHACIRPPAGAR